MILTARAQYQRIKKIFGVTFLDRCRVAYSALSQRAKGGRMKVKIGELAKMTGCEVVTIRYYEKEGRLKEPERTEGNYRV